MEVFDVYDENRNPLGYTKARGSELLPNEYNMGVEIWIINNNKLLMSQRSLLKSHAGKWEVPGGCSQTTESSIDTLIREVKEEIGVTITKDDVELLDTVIYKKQFVDVYSSNIMVDINNIRLQDEEVSDIKFFSKEEFIELVDNEKMVESVYQRYEQIKDKLGW